MAFNLAEYIKRNLVGGFIDGTWTESKVAQLSVSYLEKGYLTMEDVSEVDLKIQEIKREREVKVEEEYYGE
jgi:hypothetical protein